MTGTRVRDVFPLEDGLFSKIAALAPDLEFPLDLDLLLISKCGNRNITPIVEMLLDSSGRLSAASLGRLAALIVSEYLDSWKRVREALELEYNPLTSNTYHEEETTASEGESGDTNKETQATDVSPSLSDLQKEYLSDGKTTSEATGTGTTRSSVTRTLDRSSSASSYRNSDVVRAEIEMRVNSRFVAQIISDVKNYVAMQIY